jgi:hypothetical protein
MIRHEIIRRRLLANCAGTALAPGMMRGSTRAATLASLLREVELRFVS